MILDDFILMSKIVEKPFARRISKKDYLFYDGSCWEINEILKELYLLDTDVYAQFETTDINLNQLFQELSEDNKLSIKLSRNKNWITIQSFKTSQEEFLQWLSDDLQFELFTEETLQ